MAQSLANVILHVVFSTKGRQEWIDSEIETELYAYLSTTCRELGCPAIKVGGATDHVHIACSLSRTLPISKLLEQIKSSSSKWLKTKGPKYQQFAWQNGYGAFSIGQSQAEDLKRYITNQRRHHQRETFQEEYRKFLQRYQIEFDERYVWE